MNMKKIMFILVLAVTVLSGCHTVRGVGKDVQAGGEAIERATY